MVLLDDAVRSRRECVALNELCSRTGHITQSTIEENVGEPQSRV